jgi:hypothetical protein
MRIVPAMELVSLQHFTEGLNAMKGLAARLPLIRLDQWKPDACFRHHCRSL